MPLKDLSKNIFNDSGTTTSQPATHLDPTTTRDTFIAVDYPSSALWSKTAPNAGSHVNDVFKETLLGVNFGLSKDWPAQVLRGVRQQLANGKFGIFSPAFPRFQKESGNGDGVSVTRYIGDSPIKQPFVGKDWHQGFQELAAAMKSIARTPGQADANITLGSGNDVVLLGWLGNGQVNTGAGHDIILASPQVQVAMLYDHFTWVRPLPADQQFADAFIYYPVTYAEKGSKFNPKGNRLNAGIGDDLLFYDGGVTAADGGEGNDILAPGFGAFNWGLDTLIQGEQARSLDRLGRRGFETTPLTLYKHPRHRITGTWLRGDRALLGPVNLFDRPQDSTTLETNYGVFGYDLEWNAYDMPNRGDDGIITLNLNPLINSGFKRSKEGIVSLDRTPIDYVNKIGGLELLGGPGNDLIYGLDPGFYQGFETAGSGKGKRLAFNYGEGKPERYLAQIFTPVHLFGGSGSDYFSFGNPRNLEPVEFGNGASYIYRVSGNSDAFDRPDTLAFGSKAQADIFDFSLSYAGNNWSTVAATIPGSDGSTASPDGKQLASLGFEAMKTAKDLLGAWGGKVPIFGAFAQLGAFALKISDLFKPAPREPITISNTYYQDPIGNWRYKVNLQDWDPLDAITFRIDPSNTSSDTGKRWQNVKFDIRTSDDTDNRNSLDINYQLATDTSARPLIRLENWGDSTASGHWYGYDFTKNKEVALDASHLGFFGQVSIADTQGGTMPTLKAYIDQYRFPVEAGTRVFRWADTGILNNRELGQAYLDQLRSSSERITVMLDTMTLGYFWDMRYAGTAAGAAIQDLRLDESQSKLWIRVEDKITGEFQRWDSYSLAEINANPELKTKADLATPKWRLKPPSPALTLMTSESASEGFEPMSTVESEQRHLAPVSVAAQPWELPGLPTSGFDGSPWGG